MGSEWFDAARFGMFVHFGHVAQRGCELSWPLVGGIGALPGSTNVVIPHSANALSRRSALSASAAPGYSPARSRSVTT